MPLKLNVGLSKKVGEANYGSRGASVNLELEVEAALVNQPEELQDRIRRLFRLARTSVEEELGTNGHASQGETHANSRPEQSNGPRREGNGRPATESQCRAIRAIAGRQRTDLVGLLRSRFNTERVEDLSLSEASNLIDELKQSSNNAGGR